MIRVPASVTELPQDVFRNCPCLKLISLPAELTKIHEDAFWGTDNVENLYFGGTEKQWNALMENVYGFCPQHIYFNAALDKDGNPVWNIH